MSKTVDKIKLAAYNYLCWKVELLNWVNSVVPGADLKLGNFGKKLKDGVILCKLVNEIQVGIIKRVFTGATFKQMENINNFLGACAEIGVPDHELFASVDLFELKNMYNVLVTVDALAKHAESIGFAVKATRHPPGHFKFSDRVLTLEAKKLKTSQAALKFAKNMMLRSYEDLSTERRIPLLANQGASRAQLLNDEPEEEEDDEATEKRWQEEEAKKVEAEGMSGEVEVDFEFSAADKDLEEERRREEEAEAERLRLEEEARARERKQKEAAERAAHEAKQRLESLSQAQQDLYNAILNPGTGGSKNAIPAKFTWSGDGTDIAIGFAADNFKALVPLHKNNIDGSQSTIVYLPDGKHQYLYKVDGKWKVAADQATTQVGRQRCNIIDVDIGFNSAATDNSPPLYPTYSYGAGEAGQTGSASSKSRAKPAIIKRLGKHKVVHLACGAVHVLFACDDGEAWAMGGNQSGQLGLGMASDRVDEPRRLPLLAGKNIKKLYAGFAHSAFQEDTGKIFLCGNNEFGQSDFTSKEKIVLKPTSLKLNLKIVMVALGFSHSLALTEDGRVVSWGSPNRGQLGRGDIQDGGEPNYVIGLEKHKIVQIDAGYSHSCALSNKGELFMFGYNGNGQLGLGNTKDQSRPCRVKLSSVIMASCGAFHSAAVLKNNDVLTWGRAGHGRLALSTKKDVLAPHKINALAGKGVTEVRAGRFHSVARTKDGDVLVWGSGIAALAMQLAMSGENPELNPLLGKRARIISCSENMTMVADTSGDAYTFGQNNPRLKLRTDKSILPKLVEGLQGTRLANVAMGFNHVVALTAQGELYAWGENRNGCCGIGTDKMVPQPEIITALEGNHITRVTCGYSVTFFLSAAGKVYGCGFCSGKMLMGRELNSVVPIEIESLSKQAVRDIAIGPSHFVYIRMDGAAFTSFSSGKKGQYVQIKIPEQVCQVAVGLQGSYLLSLTGKVYHIPMKGNEASPMALPEKVKMIASGANHALALGESGVAYGWGENKFGQLGVGNNTDSIGPIRVASAANEPLTYVACGNWHSVVATENGKVYTMGSASSGQLGLGDQADRNIPTHLKIFDKYPIQMLACGEQSTIAAGKA